MAARSHAAPLSKPGSYKQPACEAYSAAVCGAAGSHGAPAEPSEEVRLALVRLAAGPVLARGGRALPAAAPDLAAALRHALADPCPDIIKARCPPAPHARRTDAESRPLP